MEHLIRNANNNRLIYTIKKINKNKGDVYRKEKEELKNTINKLTNVLTGLTSSVISACIVSILKNEGIFQSNFVFLLLAFLLGIIVIWAIIEKIVLYLAEKIFNNDIVDLSSDNDIDNIEMFNSEIMQKIAEVQDAILIIQKTDIAECKLMNYVLSLYSYQEIVDFLYKRIIVDQVKIRKMYDGDTELLQFSYNSYTIFSIMQVVSDIGKNMVQISINDETIKSIQGIGLLQLDLKQINSKLDDVNSKLKDK